MLRVRSTRFVASTGFLWRSFHARQDITPVWPLPRRLFKQAVQIGGSEARVSEEAPQSAGLKVSPAVDGYRDSPFLLGQHNVAAALPPDDETRTLKCFDGFGAGDDR